MHLVRSVRGHAISDFLVASLSDRVLCGPWQSISLLVFFFFQAEDGIRDADVTGVQTCALPICHLHCVSHYPLIDVVVVNHAVQMAFLGPRMRMAAQSLLGSPDRFQPLAPIVDRKSVV